MATSGQSGDAIELLRDLCEKYPHNADAWFLQGTIYGKIGSISEAVHCLQQSIKLKPHHALSYFNLGIALLNLGNPADAAETLSRAHELAPEKPEILQALATANVNLGLIQEAIKLYRKLLTQQPGNPDAHGKLAACCYFSSNLEEAVKHYRLALSLKPDAIYHDGLGATLCQQGKHESAISAHRNALRMQPNNARFHSNLLLGLNYMPNISRQEILQEHKQWAQQFEAPISPPATYSNSVEVGRRLKVGYVSPDFRNHSVAYFFEPILSHHDRGSVETYCYACTHIEDETTHRLQQAANHWRDISQSSDEQAAMEVRADQIDILVDLAGHTAKNRLTLFARKPAPVQVTYLGYPATTGLSRIDYRLTDSYADPEDNDEYYTEQLTRLPGCFLCYQPPHTAPPVAPSPRIYNGYITFGSFNNLAKINDKVIALWARILHAVPESHLLIKNPSLTDQPTADRYRGMFEQQGVPADRIELLGLAPTTESHLTTYSLIDIALDTFPYNGTTTTCEALYMGVPVITLKGKSHAGRVGTSLLSCLQLHELICDTSEDYFLKAKLLAGDPEILADYRATLRSSLQRSPLCDGQAIAQNMERVYKAMWKKWLG